LSCGDGGHFITPCGISAAVLAGYRLQMLRAVFTRSLWWLLVLLAAALSALAVRGYVRSDAVFCNPSGDSADAPRNHHNTYIAASELGRFFAIRVGDSYSKGKGVFEIRSENPTYSDVEMFNRDSTSGFLGIRFMNVQSPFGEFAGMMVPAWYVVGFLWAAAAVPVYVRYRRRRRQGPAFEVIAPGSALVTPGRSEPAQGQL
jgi:hypothetical protein